MANVDTSTVAYATQQASGQLVFIASDGTACVLLSDGTNQVFNYAAPPYSSWTTVTLVAGQYMALAGRMRAGADTIDTVTGASGTVRPNYRPLTKSGAAYAVGSATVVNTTAAGTVGIGNVMQYCGQDPQGRHWIVCGGASTYLASRALSSPANTPAGTWTSNVSTTQTGDQWQPAGDIVGNYLLKTYWNGTAIQWHRLDVSVATLGAWSTAATIPNLGGSPNASSHMTLREIGGGKALLTYSTGSGIYAQVYDSVGNTWSAASQLSTTANDRHPTIAADENGAAWVFWSSYVAANNYALVYKKYNGSSWDAGATTLVASGTNIANPSAGFGADTIGVTWTQGTASPYTVGWATVTLHQNRAISGVSAALSGPTALTLYGSDDPYGAPLTSASKMATGTGGTEIAKTGAGVGGGGTYVELWPQGGSVTSVSAIPANPTGHGWAFAPGAGTFGTQNWDAHVAYASTNTGVNGSQTVRFWNYSGGSYTFIGTLASGTYVTASGRYVPTLTPTAFAAVDFADGDLLYVEAWINDSSGAGGSTVTTYVATDSTAGGVAGDAQFTTALFAPAATGTTSTRDLATVSAAVAGVDVSRSLSSVSAAVQALSVGHALASVSAATKQLGIPRASSSVSTAVQQVGIPRVVSSISGALRALDVGRPLTSVSSATKALAVGHTATNVAASVGVSVVTSNRAISSISGAVLQPGISRPLADVRGAMQAQGVPRPLVNISSAVAASGCARPMAGVSASLSTLYARNVSGVGAAVQALGLSRSLVTLSASVVVTRTRQATTVSTALRATTGRTLSSPSAAVKALGVPHTLLSVAGAIGQGGLERTISGVSVALAALSVQRTTTSTSAAVKQTGIERALTSTSAAVKQTGLTRPLVSVAVAVQQVGVSRPLVGVSLAVQALGRALPISSVSTSLVFTGERSLVEVSVGVQALGVRRPLAGVVAAIGVAGLTRPLVGIAASLSVPLGGCRFATMEGTRGQATMEGVRGQATMEGVRGQATMEGTRGTGTMEGVRGTVTMME